VGGGGLMCKGAEIGVLIIQSAITGEASHRWLDHFCPLLWRYNSSLLPPLPECQLMHVIWLA